MMPWNATTYLKQTALKHLGYSVGALDGLAGPKTAKAEADWFSDRVAPIKGGFDSFSELLAGIAESQVGEREEGNNSGDAVEKYQAATWLPIGSWPWCAAFVCWCFREALDKKPSNIKRPRTASAWDFENWAKKEGIKLIKPANGSKVRRGDILVYTFSHIGIAVGDEQLDGKVDTVEGNTNKAGAREGDGVYRKIRDKLKIRSIIRL